MPTPMMLPTMSAIAVPRPKRGAAPDPGVPTSSVETSGASVMADLFP